MNTQDMLSGFSRGKLSQPHVDMDVVIKVFQPGSIGGTPYVEVVSMQAGIDWDKGRMLLEPAMPLTALSAEDVAAIHASAKQGQSWHAYQQYMKQDAKIKALEKELAELKAQLQISQ